MKIFLKVVFLFLLCAGLFSLYKVILHKHTKIKSIQLSFPSQAKEKSSKDDRNPPILSIEEQKKLLSFMEKYKDRFIWSVNLKDIAQEIRKMYPSKKAFLRKQLPNKLEIYLQESHPAFLILTDKGQFHPVSFDGSIEAALSANQLLDLPITRGDIFKKDKNLRLQIIQLLKILPNQEFFSPENISEIVYKAQRESFIVFLIPHYFVLEIKEPFKEKTIKNINFVLNYLVQKEEKSILIDARFPEKIIVRRENGS